MNAKDFLEYEIGECHDNPNISNEIMAEVLEKYANKRWDNFEIGDKHITSPQTLIHYCIHCAMTHEESEMQDAMQFFINDAIKRERLRVASRLKEMFDQDSKRILNDFIIDLMRS